MSLNYLWVSGAHSSGTRLVKRIVEASGLQGVRHHTYPISAGWNEGRACVWVTRDRFCTAHSMVHNGHADNLAEAYDMITLAEEQMQAGVIRDTMDTYFLDYEDVVANVDQAIAGLAMWLGVEPWEFDEEIFDGNEKYL